MESAQPRKDRAPAGRSWEGPITAESIVVRDNPNAQRFEAWLGEHLAGFAEYRLVRDRIIFTHTEVTGEFEGRGVGSALARGALDNSRSRGRAIRVLCPFIAAWVRRHPDYAAFVSVPDAKRSPADVTTGDRATGPGDRPADAEADQAAD